MATVPISFISPEAERTFWADQLAEFEEAERREELERIERHAGEIIDRCRSLKGFAQEAWKVLEPRAELRWSWHMDAICAHLEAVTDGRVNRLLINVPPGSSKSLLVSVLWPAWEWGPRGLLSLRYLATSYNDGPVKRDTRKCRDLILSEWYQTLWPDVRMVRSGETSFANSGTGTREGMSFGSLTSQRGDRLLIDDPHSTETAESDTERARTTRQFREGALDRLNDLEKSAIVIIMQRLHEQDVTGVIEGLPELGFCHLVIPMRYEARLAEKYCPTAIGWTDPRTEEGELMDPVRFPPDAIRKLEVGKGSYAWNGQYQQRPAPRSGGIFQRSDFEIVDVLPARIKRRVRAWDFAASSPKNGSDPDYTVGGLGLLSHDGEFFIADIVRGQWTSGKVEQVLKNTASQDGVACPIRMPQDPGAAGKADAANKIKMLAGYAATAKPVTGDKATRARPASAQAEAGNIKLLRGAWNEAFLDEVCSFPNAAHDDQVDVLSDIINELALGSSYNLAALAG